jgi:hypothetical protein
MGLKNKKNRFEIAKKREQTLASPVFLWYTNVSQEIKIKTHNETTKYFISLTWTKPLNSLHQIWKQSLNPTFIPSSSSTDFPFLRIRDQTLKKKTALPSGYHCPNHAAIKLFVVLPSHLNDLPVWVWMHSWDEGGAWGWSVFWN